MLSDPERIPSVIHRPNDMFADLGAFQTSLLDALWLWPLLGCSQPHACNVHSDGDIHAHVLPVRRKTRQLAATPVLHIQSVIHAKKYPGFSSPVRSAHLVLSLVAWWYIDGVAGAPLISFYRKGEDGRYRLSIHRDIDEVFHGRQTREIDGETSNPQA
jgi:hypothetical protein